MNDKNLRTVGISALIVSVVVTMWVMMRAAGWEINSGGIPFILWAASPYICLFLADVVLRKIAAISKLSLLFCVTAILMLGFTLLVYIGAINGESSTESLIFLFAPFYLYVGGVIVFGIGLILTLLAKLPKSW